MAYQFECPHCHKVSQVSMSTGPRPGGVTYQVREYCNEHSTPTRRVTRTEVLRWGLTKGFNPSTVLTQYNHWVREVYNKGSTGVEAAE